MKMMIALDGLMFSIPVVAALVAALPGLVAAHCDTLAGPVVATAQKALEKGDVTPVLKWIKPENEGEIRALFDRTLKVRAKGAEAKDLADMYFYETLVRIHRAGEGAPYTGLKPGEAIEPIIRATDEALKTGDIEEVVKHVTKAVEKGIRERFASTAAAAKHADESVAAGREYVENYVVFTHYVEGVAMMAEGGAGEHGHAEASAPAEHGH